MTTALICCSHCNSSTPMAVENDLFVCRRCGYRPPTPDQMASVLRRSLESWVMIGRPEAWEKLQQDQYTAHQYCAMYFRSGGVFDQVPSLDPEAPAHIVRLWEMVHKVEDDVPELYEDEM